MIGACDICDRQNVPVSHFNASAAHPETGACFICQGEDDPDPYGELEEAQLKIHAFNNARRET